MAKLERIFLMAMVLIVAVAASTVARNAYAGHKCPDRFFKKVKASGVGDTEANAQQAYKDDVAKQADKAKSDCTGCECDEEGEQCTFKYTYLKKPKCKASGPGFKCAGWIRPGCFCMDPDEDFLAVSPAPSK